MNEEHSNTRRDSGDGPETCPQTSDYEVIKDSVEPQGRGTDVDVSAIISQLATTAQGQMDEGSPPPLPTSKRYEILEPLGHGGMGVVYRVHDYYLGRELAMKLIRSKDRDEPDGAAKPEELSRFVREAAITAKLDHPGVVPIHDFGLDNKGRIFFTMRLVRGKRLDRVFKLAHRGQESWTQTRVLHSILNICETMAFAHSRGIIHRDLKPQNIMVGPFGETYVMDWGLAKSFREEPAIVVGPETETAPFNTPSSTLSDAHESSRTRAGAVIGTVMYMPPEQASGQIDEVDERSDIYSVGAILYELLASCRPYSNVHGKEIAAALRAGPPTSIQRINPKVPAELVSICEKAMARRKQDRYSSMHEMADDLRAYLEHRVVRAYQTGAWAELQKWVARNRSLATVALLAVLITIGGLLVIVDIQSRANARLKGANDTIRSANVRIQKETNLKQQALDQEKVAHAEAESERRRVEGLLLARRASEVATSNPEQAMLLSLEAHQLFPGFAANSALFESLKHYHPVRTFSGHRGRVRTVSLSPDGTRLVTASEDKTAIIWDVTSGKPLRVLIGHPDWVREAWFSPDGHYLVTASNDPQAILWDAETGTPRHSLRGHEEFVLSVTFSADSSMILTTSADGSARLWDTNTGEERFVLQGHNGPVIESAFCSDGSKVITGSADGTARIWDAMGGRIVAVLGGHSGGVGVVQFSPSGKMALTTAARNRATNDSHGNSQGPRSNDHFARVWMVHDGTLVHQLEHDAPVLSAAFDGTAERLVTGTIKGTAHVWNVQTGQPIKKVQLASRITEASFTPDNRRSVLATEAGTIWLYSLDSDEVMQLNGHSDEIQCLGFGSHDRLISASADNTAKIWTIKSPGAIDVPPRLNKRSRMAFGPDGQRLILGHLPTESLTLIRLSDGTKVADLEHDALVADFKFDRDCEFIATLTGDGVAYLWSADDGKFLTKLDRAGEVNQIDLAGPGILVCASRSARQVTVWKVAADSTEQISRIENVDTMWTYPFCERVVVWSQGSQSGDVWDVVRGIKLATLPFNLQSSMDSPRVLVTAGGNTVVLSSVEGSVTQLWDCSEGRIMTALDDVKTMISGSYALNANGTILATDAGSGGARVWDASSGRLIAKLVTVDQSAPLEVTMNASGSRVVTRTSDRLARLWNAQNGQLIVTLDNRNDLVRFAGDSFLATLNANGGELVLWDAERGERLGRLEAGAVPFTSAEPTPDEESFVVLSADGTARLWPINVSHHVHSQLTRSLTPDERDHFEIGTSLERAAYRATWERDRLMDWLVAVASTPIESKEQRKLAIAVVREAIVTYRTYRAAPTKRDQIVRDLTAIRDGLRQRVGESAVLSIALGNELYRHEAYDAAANMWQSAMKASHEIDSETLVRWAGCLLGKLGKSPTEVRESLPRHNEPAVEDIDWLLAQYVGGKVIRIKAGGSGVRSADGTDWHRDCFYSGGHGLGESESNLEIGNTKDDVLYQSERWFESGKPAEERGYAIPVPPGSYRVVLHFAEIVFQPPDGRVFDVLAEGREVLHHVDTLANGFAVAEQKEFITHVVDGVMNLEFRGVLDNPKISAIEIHALRK